MMRIPFVLLSITMIFVTGCSSRSVPPPPLDTSMDLNAREQKLPYVDPSLPSGNLEDATDTEREAFTKTQHERLKKQQDEIDDIRRQKFQDGYYKSRYPSQAN